MSSNRILGLIFANTNEENVPDLTAHRTMGSVPFGGKYRLIDFALSNMSNSGINNVGIIAKNNFLSLMDHLGSGSAWDLARRRSGLTVLSPYKDHSFENTVETLFNLHGYVEHGDEDYVLLAQSDCITNFDYSKMLEFHEKNNADITYVYTKRLRRDSTKDFRHVLDMDETGRVKRLLIVPPDDVNSNLCTGSLLVKKDLLMQAVKDLYAENKTSLARDFVQQNIDRLRVFGYENKGYCTVISSIKEYYDSSMDLMNSDIRAQLFDPKHPIYTKVRDDIPSKYGLDSVVKGSLIAQGCIINGTVENSIISKGVYIGQNTHIKNCIIMQDTVIGDNANLSYVIIDKDVNVSAGKTVNGCDTYPMYIAKRSVL